MIAALAALAIASAAPAAKQAVTSQSGVWSIDYGQRFCSLIRQPAQPQSPTLTLRKTPGSPVVELLIAGRGWKSGGANNIRPVDLVLKPSGTRITAEAVPLNSGSDLSGFGINYLPTTFYEDFAANEALVVMQGRKPVAEVAIPSAGKAIKALNSCNDRMLADWGVDVERQASFRSAALPVGNTWEWFPWESYPKSAVMAGFSDTVAMLLSVGADGVLTECRVVASLGNADLDQTSCRLAMKNGRYNAALDADGRPVASKELLRVNWVVPTGGQ